MASVAPTSLARQLEALFEGGSVAGLSDRQLLERFAAARDEAAFAALVSRHGPMVLGVCRQLLGDHQHAEDAFQAVFLVLARRAGSLREPELLGNWLYGVAMRTARTARTRLARRRQSEEASAKQAAAAPAATADRALLDGEQAEALHREIDRLPGSFRMPVVLCYFEGLTLDEAAHRLRWPVGTLRSRLARAREKLRRGLTRRGVVLSTTAMAAAMAPRSASASVSSLLCDSTTRAAIAFAARHAAGGALAAPAAAQAQEVLRTMLLHKIKLAAMSLLVIATLAAGAGWLARPLVMGDEPKMEMKGAPAARSASTANATPSLVNPTRIAVNGRVLDPEGKPIANARVAALADRRRLPGDRDGRHHNILLGSAAAGADGRFTLEMTAPAASRLESLRLVAAAPGRALTVIGLKTDVERQEASIAMPTEEPVEGRLVDVQGQPAPGIVVRVTRLNLERPLHPFDAKGSPAFWPSPATTGADGRFRILGLGAGAPATYEVEDPRYAHQAFAFGSATPGMISSSKPMESHQAFVVGSATPGEGNPRPGSTITLRPAQAVEVHVVYSDTGKPAVGALVSLQSMAKFYLENNFAYGRTDAQGRARVVGWPATGYRVRIDPAEGEPYLHAWWDVDWPTASVEQAHKFKLWRGVVVRGRVIEDPSGKPVAGALVTYHQRTRDNKRQANLLGVEAVSGPDGTFRMVVMPGPGHLLAQGPGDDYIHVDTSYGEMGVGIRPSFHLYPDAHAAIDIKDGEATFPVDLHLRRGVTITGRVVGPDGKPIAEATAFGRGYTPYRDYTFPMVGFNGEAPRIAVKDGRFAIPGCDPEKPGTFYFIDLKDGLGATVELSGKSASSGPVTVRLRPTAKALFRLMGPDGKPAAGREPQWPYDLKVIINPGPDFGELNNNIDLTLGDFTEQVEIDRVHNLNLRSGPDGHVTMVNLIPGARYRYHGREFTPEPGQTVDLGDIPAPKPKD